MNEHFEKSFEQAAAFQKIWMESLSGMLVASSNPTMAPPSDVAQEMRSGYFRVLAQSWDRFMRSPQFLKAMQQWMEQLVNLRRLHNEFFGKVYDAMPSVSEQEIDDCLITLRHMENRMVAKMEELACLLREFSGQAAPIQKNGSAKKRAEKPKRANASAARMATIKVPGKVSKKTLLRAARRRDQLNNHPTQGRII